MKAKLEGIELLRAIKDEITTDPMGFDMAEWVNQTACGTTMCLAGWACHLNGFKISVDEYYNSVFINQQGTVINPEFEALELIFDQMSERDGVAGGVFFTTEDLALAWLDKCIEANEVLPFRY